MADASGARRLAEPERAHGRGIGCPVVTSLARSLQPALRHPRRAGRLFVESVAMAVAAHVAATCGHVRELRRERRGGLAAWQRRRAIAMIDANLDGSVRIADLARECRLSSGHFTHAFKASTGVTPHRWLLTRRVEKAIETLRDPANTLADVALRCGFADQSHFTRVFGAIVGCPPGEWRRRHLRGVRRPTSSHQMEKR
jgi:AraC family transcriptional regulator